MRPTVAAEQLRLFRRKSSKGEEILEGLAQIAARQAAWKPSKKETSGRSKRRKMRPKSLGFP
jgi:hypothetical protein